MKKCAPCFLENEVTHMLYEIMYILQLNTLQCHSPRRCWTAVLIVMDQTGYRGGGYNSHGDPTFIRQKSVGTTCLKEEDGKRQQTNDCEDTAKRQNARVEELCKKKNNGFERDPKPRPLFQLNMHHTYSSVLLALTIHLQFMINVSLCFYLSEQVTPRRLRNIDVAFFIFNHSKS